MARTCCPLYTIKSNATEFQLSKSQKKVLKKFRSFLMHDKRPPGSERLDGEKSEVFARGLWVLVSYAAGRCLVLLEINES